MTTVAKKIVMAITGVVWLLFLIFHLGANLVIFRGRGPFNALASILDERAYLLWIARAILAAALVLHVAAAYELARVDLSARPVGYARLRVQSATLASRTMRWTGVIVLIFLVFHVLHLTTGTIRPAPFSERDVYTDVTGGLRIAWVAAIYIVGLAAVGVHVFHATWAAFKTLGWAPLRSHPFDRRVAVVIALGLWLGFTAIPIAVLAKFG